MKEPTVDQKKNLRKAAMEHIIGTFGEKVAIDQFGEEYVRDVLAKKDVEDRQLEEKLTSTK